MRYILDLYLSKIAEIEITHESLFTLCQFARTKELSAYRLTNSLQNKEYNVDYKNVHKKVKRFRKDELIIRTKTLDRKHGSIFYRLTSMGIIAVLYHLYGKEAFRSQLREIIAGILINHGNDDFFNFFIYPFFDRATLMKIESDMIVEFFLNYCSGCAHKLMSKLYERKVIDEHGKFASKQKIKKWLSEVKNSLMEKLEDHYNTKEEKNRIMGEVNNNIFDNLLYELQFDRVSILENTMIFPIISQGKYKTIKITGFEHSPTYKIKWDSIQKDISLLLNDKKFYKIFVTTKSAFDKCYKNILECKS